MTKPTGRPRGRPKTREYVTLMARVDVALADRVKRYAAVHRQPISVVIRDALTLLMEEYPSGADLAGPHRLAAHEFLSDRYESPLDMLVGETDTAGLKELLSDTNEGVIETILSDTNKGPHIVSDTKDAMTDMASDSTAETAETRTMTPARARSRKVSDTKSAQSAIPSDSKSGTAPMLSDVKGAVSPPLPAMMSDTNVPAFDTSKYILGKLCPRRHSYHGTGQSLLRRANLGCLACDREKAQERRQAKR